MLDKNLCPKSNNGSRNKEKVRGRLGAQGQGAGLGTREGVSSLTGVGGVARTKGRGGGEYGGVVVEVLLRAHDSVSYTGTLPCPCHV